MSISTAMTNATSGMSAATRRAEVVASNIANATTPGYARRSVVLSENILAGRGFGVRVNGIDRAENRGLTTAFRSADAADGRAGLIANATISLNESLGEPSEGYGLFSAYEQFETAMRDLALSPESTASQRVLLDRATALTTEFQNLQELVNESRESADAAIGAGVRQVNTALDEIQRLNGAIGGLNESSGGAVALYDRRDQLVSEINRLIPIKEYNRADGQIDLVTREGVFLLQGSPRYLEFSSAGALTAQLTYGDGSGRVSGLSIGSSEITPGAATGQALSGGELAGHFTVRDKIMTSFQGQIDALAGDLISRFSAPAIDPTLTVGQAGMFTQNGGPLTAPTVGVAGQIEVNVVLDPDQGGALHRLRDGIGALGPGPAGDATILNNMIEGFTDRRPVNAATTLSGDYSVIDAVAGISSVIGAARLSAEASATSTAARTEVLFSKKIEATGVDTDAEVQALLLIEQAYAANARVIQTASQMINILMEI